MSKTIDAYERVLRYYAWCSDNEFEARDKRSADSKLWMWQLGVSPKYSYKNSGHTSALHNGELCSYSATIGVIRISPGHKTLYLVPSNRYSNSTARHTRGAQNIARKLGYDVGWCEDVGFQFVRALCSNEYHDGKAKDDYRTDYDVRWLVNHRWFDAALALDKADRVTKCVWFVTIAQCLFENRSILYTMECGDKGKLLDTPAKKLQQWLRNYDAYCERVDQKIREYDEPVARPRE